MKNKRYGLRRCVSSWKLLTLPLLIAGQLGMSQEVLDYQVPPQEIVELVDAPPFPDIKFSNNGNWMLVLQAPGFQSIAQAAQPVLGLADLRVNPITYTTVVEN